MNYLQINYLIWLLFLIGVEKNIKNSGSSLLLFPLLSLGLCSPGIGRITDGTLAGACGVGTGGAEARRVTSGTFFVILGLRVGALLSSSQRTSVPIIVISLINQGIIEIFNAHILPTEIKSKYNRWNIKTIKKILT